MIFVKLLCFFYRAVKKLQSLFFKKYHTLLSKVVFERHKVAYSSFRTTGVPFVRVAPNSSICIGKNFAMNNNLFGNQIGYNTPCIFIAENESKIEIGNNVGMSQTAIIAMADVLIEDNVKFGGGVKIYTSDFHSLNYMERRDRDADMQNKKCLPIRIRQDAFIGAGTTILKGVSIGERSIIGANSVVTKDVPPDEIWAGNPARFIKKIV